MQASTTTPTLNIEQLESYIQTAMTKWNVPGLSLAIVKDGQPVISKGYGTRDVDKDLPVDQHTLFPLSSGTRLFTSSALALLVAEGRLSWSDRLSDVLPGFKTGSALINQETTVTDALTFQVGLNTNMDLLASLPRPELTRQNLLDKLKTVTQPSGFRTGGAVGYLLFVAAGEIIPAITGLSWDDFIRDRLLLPLNMQNTITDPRVLDSCNNVATSHMIVGDQQQTIGHTLNHNLGPLFSMSSSADDMARWLQFHLDNGLLDKGEGDKQVLIPQAQMDEIRQIRIARPTEVLGYSGDLVGKGLAVTVFTSHAGCQVYGVGGGTDGSEAYYAFVPELNLGIAAMVNTNLAIPQGLVPWIVARYSGAPERDWVEAVPGELEKMNASAQQKRNALREKITQPSHPPGLPLNAYAGIYQHPFLGDLTIRESGETLVFSFGEIYGG